eukprot:ANDGO_02885.mRNA.1 DNA repair protein RAD4
MVRKDSRKKDRRKPSDDDFDTDELLSSGEEYEEPIPKKRRRTMPKGPQLLQSTSPTRNEEPSVDRAADTIKRNPKIGIPPVVPKAPGSSAVQSDQLDTLIEASSLQMSHVLNKRKGESRLVADSRRKESKVASRRRTIEESSSALGHLAVLEGEHSGERFPVPDYEHRTEACDEDLRATNEDDDEEWDEHPQQPSSKGFSVYDLVEHRLGTSASVQKHGEEDLEREAVNEDISAEEGPIKKRSRVPVKRITPREAKLARLQHIVHLLVACNSALSLSNQADDDLTKNIAFSLLPEDWDMNAHPTIAEVREFCKQFSRKDVVLLCSLCRLLKIRCRVVVPVEPYPLRPSMTSTLWIPGLNARLYFPSLPDAKSLKAPKRQNSSISTTVHGSISRQFEHPAFQNEFAIWKIVVLEVYDSINDVWIPIVLDDAQVSATRREKCPKKVDSGEEVVKSDQFSYYISSEDGFVVDVSPRYCNKWSAIAQRRLAEEEVVRLLSEASAKQDDTIFTKNEVSQLEFARQNEPLPSSESAFKSHPTYILEKHLSRYECIPPSARTVGVFRGAPVFRVSDKALLHTKSRWIREGRQVRAEEIPRPAKTVASRANRNTGDVLLYGAWQTDVFRAGVAENGKVPKNERGNVEVWNPSCLPIGTVQLNLPRLSITARKLGLDFAPAMTGFDVRGGRSVPRIEGIVVCSEFKEQLLIEYKKAEELRLQRATERREKECVGRWERLVIGMVELVKLRKRYNSGLCQQAPKTRPVGDLGAELNLGNILSNAKGQ